MTTNKDIPDGLGIYVHIPFCIKKCNYCAFYSLADCKESLKQSYFEALKKQICAVSENREVTSVYFGGGTPPALGAERIVLLLNCIKSSFHLSGDCEITLEVNPVSVTKSDLKMFRECGFNRLSIGMQSADDKELKVLGRAHTYNQYKECIDAAFSAGFENISTDIIFGVPLQTEDSLKDTVKAALKSGSNHISIYSLSVEEGTPFYKIKDKLSLPDEDTEDRMYYLICSLMKEHRFLHYEISSFAKPGFESKHNKHYWNCGEYLGFGAGAHSYYTGKRFSNKADIQYYITLASDNFYSPTDYKLQPFLTEEEKANEQIMLGLRTSDGIEATEMLVSKGRVFLNNGYAYIKNGRFCLTEKGYRISNRIISELIF